MNFKKLLNTNLSGTNFDEVKETKLEQILDLYDKSCRDYSNYMSSMTLSKWSLRFGEVKDFGDDINHPKYNHLLKKLFNIILDLKPKSILDAGAGGGSNTKVLYSLFKKNNLKSKFYCVENNINHYHQILDNFHNNYNMNKPHIKIPETDVTVYNTSIHKTPLPDNSVELIFSHAVIAHIPYVPAVKTLEKISQITSKYVLHIEHKNTDVNIQIHTHREKLNVNFIDYKKIYESLGFKTIISDCVLLNMKMESRPQMMCIYLGEKQ